MSAEVSCDQPAVRATSGRPQETSGRPQETMSVAVVCDDDAGQLEVTVDEDRLTFPYVWLRDNCQCPQCWHPVSRARLFRMQQLQLNIKPKLTQVEGDIVRMTWPDDHVSEFAVSWLQERSFSPQAVERRRSWDEVQPQLWDSSRQTKIPTTSFTKLMTDDVALYHWLVDLECVGLHLITGAPGEGSIKMLAGRVAFLRDNSYGMTFDVKSKKDPSNLAYTAAHLGVHTDLPQYEYVPGMQMLHCIVQTPNKGGDNVFADGFHVAEVMKEKHPDMYQTLTTVPVTYNDVGSDQYSYHLKTHVPVISLGSRGEIRSINYNNQVRHNSLEVPLSDVQPLYAALKKFDDLCYDSNNCVRHKLRPGEIVCFHNYRVLHGRDGYESVGSSERHLQGGYIDWDELRSRRRVLKQHLNL